MKKRFLPSAIIVLAALFGATGIASASTTFFSNLGQTGATYSGQYGGQFDVNASDFLTGASAEEITSAVFSFANSDDINHVMTPAIYKDNAGKPGTLVGAMTTFTVPGSVATEGTFTFANFSATAAGGIFLEAGTKYWLEVSVDQATDLPFPVVWNSTASQATDNGSTFSTITATPILFSMDSGSTWINANPSTGNTMYSLSGVPAPEPSTGVFLLGGAAVMLARRRLSDLRHK